MASKSKSKQEEALQFLDDLDSFAPPTPEVVVNAPTDKPGNEGEAAEVLAFLDEITQKSNEPTRATSAYIPRSGTPTVRKSTERVRLGGGTPSSLLPSASSSSTSLNKVTGSPSTSNDGGSTKQGAASQGGGWGWGSVWSTATAAIQQAKEVVDEQVKQLPKNEQARKWGEGVMEYAKSAQLDKLGQDFKRVGLSTLTDILNAVAPPISEHEVIQVWLSHDMQGYNGVETLAYRSLARIMEQVEGGDLVVNRGNESRPKGNSDVRDLNTIEGYDAAIKVAQANIEDLIKNTPPAQTKPSNIINSPTTYSYVYLRIQPFFANYTLPTPVSADTTHKLQQQLQFLIYLQDPEHKLSHVTVTQAVPGNWLDVWDEYDWVEDLVAEALRVGVEVIGQEYVVARMGWGGKKSEIEVGQDKDAKEVSSSESAEQGDKAEHS